MTGNSTRREFIEASIGAASAVAVPGLLRAGTPPDAASPNLVFVFADQMRGQAIGLLGEDPVITPNLDRFASEGVMFPNAVSNYPVCSPYRAMMLTGMYAHSNGVLANCNTNGAQHGYELGTATRCWSDVLRDHGYSLGYIGKWHLDTPRKPYVDTSNNSADFAWNEWTPPDRRHGFDFWYAYGTYDDHFHPEYWTTDAPRDKRIVIDRWSPEHEADMAIRYLRNEGGRYRDSARPFALVVSMNPPHMPYDMVPERYLGLYSGKTVRELITRGNVALESDTTGSRLAMRHTKNYFAQISGVDDQFGRILSAVDELGLTAETVVVFTSDHGNCLGAHEEVSKNVHYEESMRVPFVIRWPGKIRPRRDDLLLSTPDICPTLLGLLGCPDVPDGVQGDDYTSVLLEERGSRPSSQLYIWIPYGGAAWGRRGVRTHRHTLVVSKQEGLPPVVVLHDNAVDPYQLQNIAPEQPELVRHLIDTELNPWLERTNDPWLSS